MTASILLDDDDITWLNGYATEVCDAFRAEFQAAEVRFTSWQPLLLRFTEAVDYVLHSGRRYFSAVDEAHNELCVASAILGNPNPRIARLEYEPPLPGCAKSIDFGTTAEDGVIVYVVRIASRNFVTRCLTRDVTGALSLFGSCLPVEVVQFATEGGRRPRRRWLAGHHCSAATFWVSPLLSQISRFTASRRQARKRRCIVECCRRV